MQIVSLSAVLVLTVSLASAFEGSRGTLAIQTTPSGAQVYLDDSPMAESQGTPFENASMIPGSHKVRLVSSDGAFKPATYVVLIEEGGTAHLQHTFEFRTQSYAVNHLSVSPWHFRSEIGYTYKRYLGVLGGDSYDPDSIPTSTEFPILFHLGLPNGLEARIGAPIAWTTNPAGESSSAGFGDVDLGLQYTHAPLHFGVAADWIIPRAEPENLGANRHVLRLSANTSQFVSGFDLFGNLAYELHFSDQDNSRLNYGDHLKAYVRPGYLVKDIFLPYIGLRGDLWFEDKLGKESLANNGHLLSIEPGMILDVGKTISLELAIPLFLIGDKTQNGWGIHLGFSHDFSFGNSSASSEPGAPLTTRDTPAQTGTYEPVLFDAQEITNREYREFCEVSGRALPPDPQFADMPGYVSKSEYDNYPVVNVSLEDAKAYARWKGKRLPTVNEWKNAVVGLKSENASCGMDKPVAVATGKLQNGSYHLIGNVAEWVIGDDAMNGTAYFAGGYYSLPADRCADPERLVDISAQSGSSLIGFRLVSDIR